MIDIAAIKWVMEANYYEKVTFFWQNKKKAVSLHACLLTKILILNMGRLIFNMRDTHF